MNNSDQERNLPIKNIMDSVSIKKENELEQMESNNIDKINLLEIEVNLLDCVREITLALNVVYERINYELALKYLEQIREIQFNAIMLVKHRSIIDNITKVSHYIGNLNNWSLSKQETIEHVTKANEIRYKASLVLNKFASLFTVLDGQTFQEVYDKKVEEFITKTQHLTNEQICNCTSDKLLK